MHDVERCAFRRNVRGKSQVAERAECLFLQRATGLRNASRCTVLRDACEACCRHEPPGFDRLNPVVASLLYRLTERILESGSAAGCTPQRALALQRWAEAHVEESRARPLRTPSCDVVVCCASDSAAADRAIQSVLGQIGAIAIVHLVDDGGRAGSLLQRYEGQWNVVVHRNKTERGAFGALHELLPALRTEFVAVQDSTSVSRPHRLRQAVSLLEDSGAEILGAPLETPAGTIDPRMPGARYRRYLPTETLVMRRASLVDMGGIAAGPHSCDEACAELVFRAHREGRGFALGEAGAVFTDSARRAGPLGAPPRYVMRGGSLAHHAMGLPALPVACDVVLPFHGHLDYVEQSLPSVLEQEGAEAVVHLVDDATPGGAERLLRRWAGHRQVRVYRNERNIGQFATFNNVVPFLETSLVAVQDADDISLPGRLHRAGNSLRLADADVFAGQTEWFACNSGTEAIASAAASNGNASTDIATPARGKRRPAAPRIGLSRYPSCDETGYFVQNPTVVMRTAAFEAVRGFSDFGDLDRNKCGLDTEFYVRAFYARMRFFVSRALVLRYRSHAHSATQNALTGWGSAARTWTEAENARRFRMFQAGVFDPRVFGALGRHRGITQRLTF